MSDANKAVAAEQKPESRGGRGDRPARRRGMASGPTAERTAAPAFVDKVVFINRCAKVVKGGRRFSFAALVVSGDQKGRVGMGYGKSNEVSDAIKKGTERSQRFMVEIPLRGTTIPHQVMGASDGGKVLLRPASPGTGIIAGGGVRAVLESAGIKDVLSKSLGSNNPVSVVKATLNALEQLRTKGAIHSIRTQEATQEI